MNQFEITSARVSRGKRGGMLPAGKIDNTSMKPLISVIIPVFHVEHYIVRCLKSVQQQKFASLEVILVDDCGNDNSIPTARSPKPLMVRSMAFFKYSVGFCMGSPPFAASICTKGRGTCFPALFRLFIPARADPPAARCRFPPPVR